MNFIIRFFIYHKNRKEKNKMNKKTNRRTLLWRYIEEIYAQLIFLTLRNYDYVRRDLHYVALKIFILNGKQFVFFSICEYLYFTLLYKERKLEKILLLAILYICS